jgi:hypothetical protein
MFMPPSPDGDVRLSSRAALAIGVAIALCFGLTLLVFYPGVWTYDARYVYEDIAKGFRGDWQSPVMTSLWSLIDPIAPGAASLFLLIATLYWLGFGLLAFTLATRSIWLAFVLLALALSPPAFVFVGMLWRDVLFASTWLLAAALVFAVAGSRPRLRVPIQLVAVALLALGVLLRPNALIAAPLLAASILWPAQFSLKRAAILYMPVALGLFALIQVVYYGALGAVRQHPEQSIMVFDLGGISHFTGQNQFPGVWTAPQTALIESGCYRPTEWDIYWRFEPCQFVMHKLEGEEKLFGTPTIPAAWARAVTQHPIAYLQHRAAYMWNFLAGENLTMWLYDIDNPPNVPFAQRPAFIALKSMHDRLKPTPLFRAGTWLLLCITVCAFAWRRRDTPASTFALGVCGSAAVYVLTLFVAGVASDFRYAYWAVLAGLSGAMTLVRRAA